LIYTTEVIKNIVESYPIFWLLGSIFLISVIIFYGTYKKIIIKKAETENKKTFFLKALYTTLVTLVLFLSFAKIDSAKITQISSSSYANEIAMNGIYQLFSAYRNNKINYNQLYSKNDLDYSIQRLRDNILKQEPNSKFLNQKDIERRIGAFHNGGEKKYNIIFFK